MLSVLIISPDPSVAGGVSTFIESLKRQLKDTKATSFWVGAPGTVRESAFHTLRRLFLGPWRIARLVRRKGFDAVHINPSFDTKSLIRDGLIIFALRVTGYRRVLVYIHGWDADVQASIARRPGLRRLAAWLLNGVVGITVLGDSFREGLIELGVEARRIVVTRTMFDLHPLLVPPPDRPFILFMSRFDREKGARELLEAFAKFADDYPALDLVLAGKGEDMDMLKRFVRNMKLDARVRFPGYVGGAEKAQLLAQCALFALPTYYRSEGMPVALLEAMGAGKPVLVGAAGAIRSVVSDPDNGVLLDNVTTQSVTAGLKRFLDNPAFAARAGAYNAQVAAERFDARIVSAEIEQMYQKVAQC